jgi:hypothetical protein
MKPSAKRLSVSAGTCHAAALLRVTANEGLEPGLWPLPGLHAAAAVAAARLLAPGLLLPLLGRVMPTLLLLLLLLPALPALPLLLPPPVEWPRMPGSKRPSHDCTLLGLQHARADSSMRSNPRCIRFGLASSMYRGSIT